MPDDERLDDLLRRTLATPSPLAAPPDLEERLAQRLRPRRLSANMRIFLVIYGLTGVTLSLRAMHATGIDGPIALLATLAPGALLAPILRPYIRRSPPQK